MTTHQTSRPVLASLRRRLGDVALALALLAAACQGGHGSGPSAGDPTANLPSFAGPLSPRTAYFGTRGAQFVLSGGKNLEGKSFSAKLGFHGDFCELEDCPTNLFDCVSATVDASDPSKLDVVCDIPDGSPYGWTLLYVMYDGMWVYISDFDQAISFTWPPATGPASLAGASATPMTWGARNGLLLVSGGTNLPGHALTATLDGVACSDVYMSPEAATDLVLYCPTRPGGLPGTASLVVQEENATIDGGELAVDVAPCRVAGPAADGVPLPLFCNTPPGSTAAVSVGLEGVWASGNDWYLTSVALFAPDGRFISTGYYGGDWSASGSTWTPSNAEHWTTVGTEPFTTPRTSIPFVTASLGGAYLPANALLVSQARVPGAVGLEGTWGTSDAPLLLDVDASGAFTGSTSGTPTGACTLTGTITVIQSPKNMLAVSMLAAGGSACKLWQASPLTGLGFVDAKIATGSLPNAAYVMDYTLWFVVRAPGQAYTFGRATRL